MLLLTVVSLLIIANIGLVYWRDDPAQSAQPLSPTDQQLALFQAKADQACLCVRQRGSAKQADCWKDYQQTIEPFGPNRIGTTCAFEANYWDYFPPFDENGFSDKSVTLQRAHNACTAAEEAKLTKATPVDRRSCV